LPSYLIISIFQKLGSRYATSREESKPGALNNWHRRGVSLTVRAKLAVADEGHNDQDHSGALEWQLHNFQLKLILLSIDKVKLRWMRSAGKLPTWWI